MVAVLEKVGLLVGGWGGGADTEETGVAHTTKHWSQRGAEGLAGGFLQGGVPPGGSPQHSAALLLLLSMLRHNSHTEFEVVIKTRMSGVRAHRMGLSHTHR